MIINLCGPPAAGKSTFAIHLCKEHPLFEHHSIDNYRLKYKEEDAWSNLTQALIATTSPCIVESCGLSWRLHKLILNHSVLKRRGIVTIFFCGNEDDFHKRLDKRQRKKEKPDIPFKYTDLDEHGLITYCLDNFMSKYDRFITLKTDNSVDPKFAYQEFKRIIFEKLNG